MLRPYAATVLEKFLKSDYEFRIKISNEFEARVNEQASVGDRSIRSAIHAPAVTPLLQLAEATPFSLA